MINSTSWTCDPFFRSSKDNASCGTLTLVHPVLGILPDVALSSQNRFVKAQMLTWPLHHCSSRGPGRNGLRVCKIRNICRYRWDDRGSFGSRWSKVAQGGQVHGNGLFYHSTPGHDLVAGTLQESPWHVPHLAVAYGCLLPHCLLCSGCHSKPAQLSWSS